MRRFALFILLVTVLCLIGCVRDPGSFDGTGFHHAVYPYEVLYQEGSQSFVGEGWAIDNYKKYDRDLMRPKAGPNYLATLWLDRDGDGEREEMGEFYRYDLRLVHEATGAVIWIANRPVTKATDKKDLAVIARAYVDELTGTHYEHVELGGKLHQTSREKTHAAVLLAHSQGSIAGRPAYRVLVGLADLDKLKVDPNARERLIQITFVRTGALYERFHNEKRILSLPTLMVIGYAAHPDDDGRTRAAFNLFLERIRIEGKEGVEFEPGVPSKAARQAAAASSDTTDAPATVQPKPTAAPEPPAATGSEAGAAAEDGTEAGIGAGTEEGPEAEAETKADADGAPETAADPTPAP
ncbi:MAG: hypothetical protein OXT09_21520 [Myxococcales bacterium]|nr:hypothetical protein [Myxococcales bacterium]